MDGDGGLGGLWFERVKVIMGSSQHFTNVQPFFSYSQWPCDSGSPCPNVTGEIGGDIEVQWQGSEQECAPSLRGNGAPLLNGSLYGQHLMENVTVSCRQKTKT